MRMDFFNRLTEDLKAAVAHHSFDEVTALMVRYLNVKIPEKPSTVVTGLSASPESEPESSTSEPVPARSESSEEEKKEVDVSELDVSDKRLLEEINEANGSTSFIYLFIFMYSVGVMPYSLEKHLEK